jgi:hypothetical protein
MDSILLVAVALGIATVLLWLSGHFIVGTGCLVSMTIVLEFWRRKRV